MRSEPDEIRSAENKNVIDVLLVDDHRFIGVAVGRLLASESDIRLHCCYLAAEAVAAAVRIAPAVIFQDLVMPDGDGLTLVGQFRANRATARTPIIVLSAHDDAAIRARAIAAGADSYMVKLPGPAALIDSIRTLSRARPEAAHASAEQDATAADITFDRAMLDAIAAAAGPDGAGLVKALVEQFLEEAGTLVKRIVHAARSHESKTLKASAHSLKGAASTMGARRLATLAGQLEQQAERCPAGPADAGLVLTLVAELGRFRTECVPGARNVPPSSANPYDSRPNSGSAPR